MKDVFLSINNHSALLPQLSNQLLQKGISLYIEGNSIILIKGKDANYQNTRIQIK